MKMVNACIMLLLVITTSCNANTRTVAERCILIDLKGREGNEIIPLLDDFAKIQNLDFEKSHPTNPRYESNNDEVLTAEVSYLIGMGEFGAVLTLFRYDLSYNTDLVFAFDEFVARELAITYQIKQCADVEGFQLPEVYL